MNHNYRHNDPFTSVLAGRAVEVSGSGRHHRALCLHAVSRTPGLTAREIEARLGIKAHKRLPELRRLELVHNGPARFCTVSGKQALTWLPGRSTQSSTPCTGACA